MQKLLLIRNVEEKTQEFCLREEESRDCKAELMPWHSANGWQILSGISWGTRCAHHWGGCKSGLWGTSQESLWSWFWGVKLEDEGKKRLLRRGAGGWSTAWVKQLEHPLLWEVPIEGWRKVFCWDIGLQGKAWLFYGFEKLLRKENTASLHSSKLPFCNFSNLLQNLLQTSVSFPCSSYL